MPWHVGSHGRLGGGEEVCRQPFEYDVVHETSPVICGEEEGNVFEGNMK